MFLYFLPCKSLTYMSEKCHNKGNCCGPRTSGTSTGAPVNQYFISLVSMTKVTEIFHKSGARGFLKDSLPFLQMQHVHVGGSSLSCGSVYPFKSIIDTVYKALHEVLYKIKICCLLSPCTRESNTLTPPRKSGEAALLSNSADNTNRMEESSGENRMRWTGFTQHTNMFIWPNIQFSKQVMHIYIISLENSKHWYLSQ